MNKSNWDDIKFVLAVADEGSLNASARRLGVTHATVLRRVAAFEQRCGRPVFRKSLSGYSVLPEAEAILTAARNVEDAVLSVDRAVLGSDSTLSGKVRVASTDSICQTLLPPILNSVRETYPELSICLLSANTYHDLSRLAADVAIRPTRQLEEGLNGVIAGELRFAVYSAGPQPRSWIGLEGGLAKSAPAKWMSENVAQEAVIYEADSFLVAQEMAAAGLGKVFLPDFIGGPDPRLHRTDDGTGSLSVPVWCVIQDEVCSNVRIQLVRNLIVEELRHLIQQRAQV